MNSPFMEMGAGGRGATSTLGFNRLRTPLTPFGDAPKGGWPAANDPTNADSTPDYDEWGPDSWWTAQDWLTWHRALKAKYGLDEANIRFITAWQKQGIGASPLDARSFDSSFRAYAKANGFFDGLYYGLGALTKPIGVTTDVVTDVSAAASDVAAGVAGGVSTTANIAKYLIPIAAMAFAYYYFMASTPRRRK